MDKNKIRIQARHFQRIWQMNEHHVWFMLTRLLFMWRKKGNIVFWPLSLDIFLKSWILLVQNGTHQFLMQNPFSSGLTSYYQLLHWFCSHRDGKLFILLFCLFHFLHSFICLVVQGPSLWWIFTSFHFQGHHPNLGLYFPAWDLWACHLFPTVYMVGDVIFCWPDLITSLHTLKPLPYTQEVKAATIYLHLAFSG